MGTKAPSVTTGSWHRPKLYGTIVVVYLLGMSVGAAATLATYVWSFFSIDQSTIIGPPPVFYILPPVTLMAVSILAAFMLVTDMEGPFVRLIEYIALFLWTGVTLWIIFGALVSAEEAEMRGIPIEDYYPGYLVAYFLAGTNGLMYFFLHERHTIRYSYQLKLKSGVGIISMAAIGGFAVLAILYFAILLVPGVSFSLTGHPPDSFLSQPVRESPEGKAFLARYPDSEILVDQIFLGDGQCCTVTFAHYRYSSNSQTPRVELVTQVNVTAQDRNPKATIGEKHLFCYDREGRWTVNGDIDQNLRPEKKDCWDIGPPPRPSDEKIIQMAKNTTAGKAYLARYPDNSINVELDSSRTSLREPQVTFTPTISEPIQFGVSFYGLDWDISHTWIVCSNGDYHYSDEYDFRFYLLNRDNCLTSVHDKLVAANETAQAKAFITKYPNVKLHSGDSIGESTVIGSDSTIQYRYRGSWEDGPLREAHLIVTFKPGTNIIQGFEATCGKQVPTSPTMLVHKESGRNLDVAEFLQDSYCPGS